jgi:phosphate-selective porin OprO/OprP
VAPYENFFAVANPCRNFFGRGAWQVGIRYDHLDLSDGDTTLNGGVIQDVTVGLNWFWNPRMKLQWNYVYTRRDAPSGATFGDNSNMTGIGMRLAHDF